MLQEGGFLCTGYQPALWVLRVDLCYGIALLMVIELLPIVKVFLLKFNVAWFTSSVGHTLLNLGMDVTCVMLD